MSSPAAAAVLPETSEDSPVLGLDLGGTKCAVSVLEDGHVREVLRIPTGEFGRTFAQLIEALAAAAGGRVPRIGISCGGPLDVATGMILTPPNLHRSWYSLPIVARLTERFGGPVALMNDANACALAEWKFGAGRGCRNMIFLTAGTGMGAGLILNGELYEGATGDAGEIGHVRLAPNGPLGFGKNGSAEGFCSGGGIARLASYIMAPAGGAPMEWVRDGGPFSLKHIAEAAREGDDRAILILQEAGTKLGEMLAILVDVLNPERIVLGGYFPRCGELLEPSLTQVLEREALTVPRAACRILPAELGETIGSHGAVAVALRLPPAARPA